MKDAGAAEEREPERAGCDQTDDDARRVFSPPGFPCQEPTQGKDRRKDEVELLLD